MSGDDRDLREALYHDPSAMMQRRFLLAALGAASLLPAGVAQAQPRMPPSAKEARRRLTLEHLHSGEAIDIVYHQNGRYVPSALYDLNRFLRDHRDGTVHPIDVDVLDYLHAVAAKLGTRAPIGIVCGYRSERSNELLRARSSGVARRSLHMDGMALDIRIPGQRVRKVAEAALSLQRGGVGIYTGSNFVHIDSGAVRTWGA